MPDLSASLRTLGWLAPGAVLYWLSTFHPATAPVWVPWEFSWLDYLAFAFTLRWFLRGLRRMSAQQVAVEKRPGVWRLLAFFTGFLAIYGVTQTHYDYMAQHMFFLNRLQHVAMHHLGPFLIALANVGAVIECGMPVWARRICASRGVAVVLRVLQQPFIAAVLFVGLFYFWLIPPIHFHAMLDDRLYRLMNWSMVVDGLLFWSLVLDPRPRPPARIAFGTRLALSASIIFPQIVLGAFVTFAHRDLYPYYDLCGRLFPAIGALEDQHLAGIVMWIPTSMMGVIGALIVLRALLNHNPATVEVNHDSSIARP